MKSGFVNIFGKPNAGKSTLLNALAGEKLAIVSHKVQTTRHRIKAIVTTDDYQIVFSDTPGIIDPKYKLHEKMMQAVKGSLEDADVALLVADAGENPQENDAIFSGLKLKADAILILNKIDSPKGKEKLDANKKFYAERPYGKQIIEISALKKAGIDQLLQAVADKLPEGPAFFEGDEISDMPMKFFTSELIREKIFQLYHEEIPYHAAVLVQEYKEKSTLTKIRADIIVQRETQKGIILGDKGSMIRKLGTEARESIEAFIGTKVFLELFVKVRPGWREKDTYLKEYGY